QRERTPLVRVVPEQLADPNDLDVLFAVGVRIVCGAVRRVGSERDIRLDRGGLELLLQRIDRALLRLELYFELADQVLLCEKLLTQRAHFVGRAAAAALERREPLARIVRARADRFALRRRALERDRLRVELLALLGKLALEVLDGLVTARHAALELDDPIRKQLPLAVLAGQLVLGVPYDLLHAGERVLVLLDALLQLEPVGGFAAGRSGQLRCLLTCRNARRRVVHEFAFLVLVVGHGR